MWQRCMTLAHRCHIRSSLLPNPYTGLLVGVWIEPFSMPVPPG